MFCSRTRAYLAIVDFRRIATESLTVNPRDSACTDDSSPSDCLTSTQTCLGTFPRLVHWFNKRRTFADPMNSVTATLADPNGVCGENRRGLNGLSVNLNQQPSATNNVYHRHRRHVVTNGG